MTVTSAAEFALWADEHVRKCGTDMGRECAEKFAGILASKKVRRDPTLLPSMDVLLSAMQAEWSAKLVAVQLDAQSIRIFNEAFHASLKVRLGELRPAILADEARLQ